MARLEIDSWLTAVRVRRLPQALLAIRTHPPPGVPEHRVARVIWNQCDGPLDDVQGLLEVLRGAGLVDYRGSHVRVTRHGHRVATQNHQHGGRLLAKALIDGGFLRSQARQLLSAGDLSVAGDLVCSRNVAVAVGAQLTGLLRLWEGVTLTHQLWVPAPIVQELLAAWSLQPIPRVTSEGPSREVGDRAESYSYRWEQEKAKDPSLIQWVALDDDSLGFDILNRGGSPERCIEVKGSQQTRIRFFLTANEWATSSRKGAAYEVQFWGGISVARPRLEEYEALRQAGYPLVFADLQNAFRSGALKATPSEYVVTGGAESSSGRCSS